MAVQRRDFLTGLARVVLASAAAPLVDACSGGGNKSGSPTTRSPTRVPPLTRTPRGLHTPDVDVTGATDVTAGLQAFIDSVADGATITFSANGSAHHSLGASGIWDQRSDGSYHVHWDTWNSDDYFTISPDGMHMPGTYGGRTATNTRAC